MRALIGEWPNMNPTGLGNSATDIDMDSYRTGNSGGDDVSEKFDVEMEAEELEKELADDEIDEDEPVDKEIAQSDNTSAEQKGKTAARPGKSKPADRGVKEQKKKRKLEDFAEIAEAEEVTRQKELDLAKATVEKDRAKLEAKAAETAYKMQKLQDKIAKRKERAEEKATKLRLLEYRQTHGFTMSGPMVPPASSPFQAFNNHTTSNPEHYAATASSSGHYYRTDFAQTGSRNYGAGPSTHIYDDGRSSEASLLAFNGDDGGSSSSGGTAFSDGLDPELAQFGSQSFASSSGTAH
jgi:hypothetical protein